MRPLHIRIHFNRCTSNALTRRFALVGGQNAILLLSFGSDVLFGKGYY